MKKIAYVESSVTGGHYAFQTEKSKNPFCNPMGECKSIKLNSNDVVVDIGAYVGEYTMYAARQGVKKIISYEATPSTFDLLKKNTNKYNNVEIHNLAVVGDDRKECELFLSNGIGATNSIEKKLRKAGNIKVNAIRYEEAIKEATVVKIDVEGAEYDYDIIQPNLRAIILEFHPLTQKDWKGMAYLIMNRIKDAGFKAIVYPTFKNGWALNSSWIR
tara:strand:+ start:40 stop:687 length:648 start_codon:yes stop_codon:yes gene_type:complete